MGAEMAPRHRDEINVLRTEPAEIEKPLDRSTRKRAIVFFPAKPFLIDGSDDYAVSEQDSARVVRM